MTFRHGPAVIELACGSHSGAFLQWLRANGFDPSRIPKGASLTVDNDARTLAVEGYDVGSEGRILRGPDGEPRRSSHTIPLVVLLGIEE